MPHPTKLRFIQILPNASTAGDFTLKDLPGSGKRIDVLCRVLSSCFEWAPNTWDKDEIEVIAVIGDSVILRFQFPEKMIPSGEKAWAQVIKESLMGNPPDCVRASEGTLESVIIEFDNSPSSNLWLLHEEGEELNLQEIAISGSDNSFMLGDNRGFNSQTEELISKYTMRKVSLGETSYLSSHCVAHIISEFERKDK
jgi:tRNA (pseudouridine54-N1)-methyltransferase